MKEVIIHDVYEVEKILNRRLYSYEDILEAAKCLLNCDAKSVFIKEIELANAYFCQDYWTNGEESFWFSNPRLAYKNSKELDTIFDTTVPNCLALGYCLKDALVIAKMYVNRALRLKVFEPTWPEDECDLPLLSHTPLLRLRSAFKSCEIGLYPVVDSSLWLEKLLALGVKCIQLRIKDKPYAFLEEEIKHSVYLAKKYQATLFINDYWEEAIRLGAAGVHLGQEDLFDADIDKIQNSGLYLGISTHCYYEVARAHALKPSYIACGPIYPTTSKKMAFEAQGVLQLQRWRRTLHYTLVAIGGINLERLPEILQTGVQGVSLISAITQADNPTHATKEFLTQIKEYSDA